MTPSALRSFQMVPLTVTGGWMVTAKSSTSPSGWAVAGATVAAAGIPPVDVSPCCELSRTRIQVVSGDVGAVGFKPLGTVILTGRGQVAVPPEAASPCCGGVAEGRSSTKSGNREPCRCNRPRRRLRS